MKNGLARRSTARVREKMRCMGQSTFICLLWMLTRRMEKCLHPLQSELFCIFALAVCDGGAGFAIGFAAALGFALIPVLFAFGDGQLALHLAAAKVEPGGDERMTLDLRL